MDKYHDVGEAVLSESPGVKLSTEKIVKYDITKTGVLDHCQILWKRKYEIFAVSDGDFDKSYIEEMSDMPI